QGYGDIFLDCDKNDGIALGSNWKHELYSAMKRAHAVLVLVSERWFESGWSQAEYRTAVMNGKAIIPLLVAPAQDRQLEALRHDLQRYVGDVQFVQLAGDWKEGLERLAPILGRSRIGPQSFPVDRDAPPYKGLSPYTLLDAGLFFGRESETQDLLERLRQATGSSERLILLVGASGAGKSSLLRAGVWPQLGLHPHLWLPIEPFIPEHDLRRAITPSLSFARAVARTFDRCRALPRNPADLADQLAKDPAGAAAALVTALRTAAAAPGATLVIGIDQGEELLRAPSHEQRQLIDLISEFVNVQRCLALLTIRVDTLDGLQETQLLERVSFATYLLHRMPLSRIPDIIRDPARRVGVTVEPALVDQATKDAITGDALPLLSFALERLWMDHGRTGSLTHDAYEAYAHQEHGVRISPIEATVVDAATEALGPLSAAEEATLAEAFVPGLVDLTDSLTPVRRRARWSDLPDPAKPLMRRLVEARLLTTGASDDSGSANDTLEVAHEALLRRWPLLARRIEAAVPDIRFAQDVERAADDFARASHASLRPEYRHSGRRLARASKLVGGEAWRRRIGPVGQNYLNACRRAQRHRRLVAVASAAAAIVLTASLATIRNARSLREDFRLRATRAAEIDAVRFALAALPSRTDILQWVDMQSQASLSTTLHESGRVLPIIVLAGTDVRLLTPDGSRILSGNQVRDAAGNLIATIGSQDDDVWASADGSRLLTTDGGRNEYPISPIGRLWDVTGAVLAEWQGGIAAPFSDDPYQHSLIAKGKSALDLRDGRTGAIIAPLDDDMLPSDWRKQPVFFARGTRFFTASDRSIKLRDSDTGGVIRELGAVSIFEGPPAISRFVSVSTDGGERTYSLHDAESGSVLSALRKEPTDTSLLVRNVAFAPAERIVMDGTGGITVHDGANGRPLFNLPERTTWVFSVDGTRMVTLEPAEAGSASSRAFAGAHLRDGGTGVVVADIGRLGGAAAASVALFSPDGTRLVVVDATRQVTIRDGRTGAILVAAGHFTPDPISGRSLDAAFSPDSSLAALLLDNHKAVIYDVRNSKKLAELPDVREVHSFVGPRLVVTTGVGGTWSLWNAESGSRVAHLGFASMVRSIGNRGWIETIFSGLSLVQRVEPVEELRGSELREYVCRNNARFIGPFPPSPLDEHQRLSDSLVGLPWDPCDWRGLRSIEGWSQLARYWSVRLGMARDYVPGERRAFGDRPVPKKPEPPL
ncbi:MAG: TIR domain-containing protein, partial [Vicinamibacterales bacterium]